jgi:hypothetical protein
MLPLLFWELVQSKNLPAFAQPDAFENPSRPEDHTVWVSNLSRLKTRPLGLGAARHVVPIALLSGLDADPDEPRDGVADRDLLPFPFPSPSPRSGSSGLFPVVQATPDQK